MMRCLIFIIVIYLSLQTLESKEKFVSITLDAKWADTLLHQEARYKHQLKLILLRRNSFLVNFWPHKIRKHFGH